MSAPPRVGFVTAVEIGAACIREIGEMGGVLDLIVTLRDDTARSKSGRADVASIADGMGSTLVRVRNINDMESIDSLRAADLDWLFIVGWSQIAHREVLDVPRRGAIGGHPTLLPMGRGRAPIPWTILQGLDQSGVTLFLLDNGVDSGPIIDQVRYDVAPDENATSLYSKALDAHRRLIRRVWPRLDADSLPAMPQDESAATYWPTRRPADGEILRTMTVEAVDRLVRAVTRPYPGAFVRLPDSTARIWRGATSKPSAAQALPIDCSDGTFWATDYAIETSKHHRE